MAVNFNAAITLSFDTPVMEILQKYLYNNVNMLIKY